MSSEISAGTLEKFTTFGDLLRFLRRRAGITQLELSIQVGYSDAQISRLEQNLRLPDIPLIEARFVSALGLKNEPQAVSRLLDLAANVRREDAPSLGLCPYKGLSYFDEADADLFIGREDLTAKLAERVQSLTANGEGDRAKFLAIVGASGSGKSSLVRAGLVPALRWNKNTSNWPIYLFTPTAHPLESLAGSLTQDTGSVAATARLMDDLAQDKRSLKLFINQALKYTGAAHFLLVVDQFEELFALCRSKEERLAFIDNLLTAVSEPDGQAVAVITLRADFYAYCAGYAQLREALARQQEYIGAMRHEELRRAVEEPARRGRWEFEPGLVDLLLHDVGHEPGALPLLSHALLETWERRRGRTLTLSGYTSSGGVRGAIAETAEAVFVDQFTGVQQSIARRIFLRLTELGEETSTGDTRRRATIHELILKPEEAAETQTVLKILADARLITTNEDSAEVAHEALIREWPTLRGWLEDNREGLRLHRHITETTQEWLKSNRDPDVLYRGARLAQGREWAANHQAEMNTQEQEFLDASIAFSEREASEREAQRERELEALQKLAEAEKQHAQVERLRAEEQARTAAQLRKRSFYLVGAFMVALAMVIIALYLGGQARQAAATSQYQQRIAFSRELAAAAVSNLEIDPERSILLALQAVSTTYSTDKTWTTEAEDALHRALLTSRVQLTLRGHTDRVWAVAFSPDGTHLATASDDGTARLWDASAGQETQILITGASRGRHGIAFSPDGRQIATVGDVGTATVWDANTGRELLDIHGHANWVSGIAFSPDGKRLATASEDRTAKVWDAETGREQLTLFGHTDAVWDIAFSPNGKQIATASEDGTVKMWDAVTGGEIRTLSGHTGPINCVIFSPDGLRLATAGEDKRVKIWDLATGLELLTIRGHTGGVQDVTFSPDGKRLATTSMDGKVKVWDSLIGQELLEFNGHSGPVIGAAFSPDCVREPDAAAEQCGTRLATASFDGTAKVWNASFSQELLTLYTPSASAGDFSPDGTQIATGFLDGSLTIWNISNALQEALQSGNGDAVFKTKITKLPDQDGAVWGVAFSSDGKQLSSGSEDGTVKVWDAATGQEQLTLRGHKGGIYDIAFSLDGKRLATASDDYTVKVWDLSVSAGGELLTISIPMWTNSIAFSPDGTRLATAINDGTAKVWDAASGKELLVLRGHTDGVFFIVFSPDGTRLATGSDDGSIKVWDAVSGKELLTLLGHTGWVNGLAYSPDGTLLASAGQDGVVKVWDGATGSELLSLRGHTDAVSGVAFSPDGARLFSSSADDGTTRAYLLQIQDLLALGRTRLTRELTTNECQLYLHLPLEQCLTASPELTQELMEPEGSPTAAALTTQAKGKVCEVTDEAGVHDQFFNQFAYKGVQNAAERFDWEGAVLEPQQPADYIKYITEFMHSNCDLIVLPKGPLFADLIYTVAEANPTQKFLMIDWTYEPPYENVWGQVFAVDQSSFLAGYVAASVSKTGKVATFGGANFKAVTDFMDGFAMGVEYYNQKNGTNVEVLGWDIAKHDGLFTGNFVNTEDGRQLGEMLMEQGVDVILPVAGDVGLGTAAAVKERGNASIIGVDSDWVFTYPEYADIILTSIEKRIDVSVLSAVESIGEGTFTGGTHVGTLENGDVSISPFHQLEGLITPQVKKDLEQIKMDIISGKIKTMP